MGANQSAEDSDSETEEGIEETVRHDEELEQEPEVRPFNYPQSPLQPQDSDTLLPLPEPLTLSEPDPEQPEQPEQPELAEDSDVPPNGHNAHFRTSMELPDRPPPLNIHDDDFPGIPNLDEGVIGVREAREHEPGQWSSTFSSASTSVKPPESPGLGLGTSFVSMSPVPSYLIQSTAPVLSPASPPLDEAITEIYIVRHAEATNNVPHIIGGRSPSAVLTAKGRRQATQLGMFLKEYYGIHFDAIYSSPLERARATAVAVCQELGVPEESIIYNSSLQEQSQGEWEGKARAEVYVPGLMERMNAVQPDFRAPGGETQREVEFRMVNFLSAVVQNGKDSASRAAGSRGGFVKASTPSPRLEGGGGFNLSVGVPFASHQSETPTGRNGLGLEVDVGNGGGVGNSSGNSPSTGVPPFDGRTRIAVFSHGTAIKCLLRGILGSQAQMTHKITIDNTSVSVLRYVSGKGWHVEKLNDTAHFLLANRGGLRQGF